MSGLDYAYDLTASFDESDYIYNDFAHVSRNGNEIIAKRVDTILER